MARTVRARSIGIAALAALLLAAMPGRLAGAFAPVTIATLPIATVVVFDGGALVVLTGQMAVRMNRTAVFEMASTDGAIRCAGATDRSGSGRVDCAPAFDLVFQVPRQMLGRFNGAHVDARHGYRMATGWGESADARALAGMLGR
ncbi:MULTISPECIES: hypothetical protein [unclassified Roseitalea]|uniref:hypothetical protein n=1 Tax=unclassified Roseitalea TaxID=2639107 RepID=UPI00273DB224|nr:MULTISPECIES: hypothetical protein [unclassified Roseitalea]